MKYITTVNDQQYTVEIIDEKHVLLNGTPVEVDFQTVQNQPVFSLIMQGKSYEAYVSENDDHWEVLLLGDLYTASVVDEREQRLRAAAGGQVSERGEFHLKAPMPGLIIKIQVQDGQEVQKGDVLVILESMKMQNELKSPQPGIVTEVNVADGDNVEKRDVMVALGPVSD
jgi:acetyl/propionyl-CoA carboxylase alpha subunit